MGKIQRADPDTRRWAFWLTFVVFALGSASLFGVLANISSMEAWLEENLAYLLDNVYLTVICAFIIVSPVIAGAVYLLILGNRTIKEGQFPPDGYAVSRDSPLIEGPDARTRGRIIQFLSVILLLAVMSIPLIIGYIFYSISLMLNPA